MDEIKVNTSEIDQIAGVLHGQVHKLGQLEESISIYSQSRETTSSLLSYLLEKASDLCNEMNIEFPNNSVPASNLHLTQENYIPTDISWDDITKEYDPFIQAHTSLDILLPPSEVKRINLEFNAPLKRVPWDKWDAYVVLSAAMIGIITDWFCAPLGNPLSEKLRSYGTELHDNGGIVSNFKHLQSSLRDSPLAGKFKWVDKLSSMDVSHDNLPIDYSGSNFGGQHHRVLSGGHDLLRFMSAIWQIKNGQFVGIRYEDSQAIMEVKGVSQRGVAYTGTSDWQSAIVLYLLHIAADFFTKTSLPIPGITFLKEIDSREIRIFVSDMYEGKNSHSDKASDFGGVNLRHIVGQSVTPAVVSLVIWLYYLIRYKLGGWWAARKGNPHEEEMVKGLKLNEMMAVAHTTVTGVNIGRVVITKNPTSLNTPELMTCVKQLYGLSIKTLQRRSPKARYERNCLILDEGWERVEAYTMQPLDPNEINWPPSPIVLSDGASE